MRRLKVVLLESAIGDLDEIYRYVARASGSPTTAIRFIRRIRTSCKRLGNLPFIGHARDDLEAGPRTVSFERTAVIAFKAEETQVKIVNVFYGGRDYEAFYRGSKDEGDMED
jgi:toxin ParE1/3/4